MADSPVGVGWMVWASVSGWMTPTFFFLLLNLVIGTIAFTSGKSKRQDDHDAHSHLPRALSRGASILERVRSFNFNQYRHRSDEVLHLETIPPSPIGTVDEQQTHLPRALSRGPSILERVRSFNFNQYRHRSDQVLHLETIPPSPIGTVDEQQTQLPRALSRGPSILERVRSFNFNQFRNRSDELVRLETVPPSPTVAVEEKDDPVEVDTLDDAYRSFQRTQSEPTPMAREPSGGRDLKKAASEKPAAEEEDYEEIDAKAGDFINRFKKQLQLQRLESLLRNRREQASLS